MLFYYFKIENGLVILTVEREFEVKLGIINDNLSSSWRLYQTKLFLQDPEEPGNVFSFIHQFYLENNHEFFVLFFLKNKNLFIRCM